ncbi:DUF4262 domain-containing protein [Nocardia sp. NPDC051570]|uniref:DUF4262 domain-containing protein n=1 Tax=Nocardia sp. NPDC051570 TaxID=3364324 RepID=UPI0037A4F254
MTENELNSAARAARLDQIKSDIDKYGFTVTLVPAEAIPRFAYTIGLINPLGFDLLMTGGSFYDQQAVHKIMSVIAATLREDPTVRTVDLDTLGSFALRPAHQTWVRQLALGAVDYYENKNVSMMQIVPDSSHVTIDVPNASEPWASEREPVWRWVRESWEHPVPRNSVATTNLAALKGEPITEWMRWEEDAWEMFAGPGPDVAAEDSRVVPLGTLLGADPSLQLAANVGIGTGYWRTDRGSEWTLWATKAN